MILNNDHDELSILEASNGFGLKGVEREREVLGGFYSGVSLRRRVGVTMWI